MVFLVVVVFVVVVVILIIIICFANFITLSFTISPYSTALKKCIDSTNHPTTAYLMKSKIFVIIRLFINNITIEKNHYWFKSYGVTQSPFVKISSQGPYCPKVNIFTRALLSQKLISSQGRYCPKKGWNYLMEGLLSTGPTRLVLKACWIKGVRRNNLL